ncbi:MULTISPECIES: LysR family transcriptional regulator [unclassified Phaeobacter]|uniref:LysR family transcriptional regulator n=1 Tax=unclassified Phaeobacter TaxID=2621772 RepID=UPI003A8585AE
MAKTVDFRDLPEIALLQSFAAVAETRSITRAALLSGRSQPVVSQHLQRLEAKLGMRLVERSNRPLMLTSEGETLAGQIPDILASLAAVVDTVQSQYDAQLQRIRIAMPDSMSCSMGAEFVSLAGKLAESVELCAGIVPWEQDVFRALQIDFLVDSPPYDPKEYFHPLEIFTDPYVLICSTKHGDSPTEEIIERLPQVAHAQTTKFGQRARGIARGLGVRDNPKYNFDSSQSVIRFVEIGYGWAITSALCLYQSPAAFKGIQVRQMGEEDRRTLMLISRADVLKQLAWNTAGIMRDVFRQLVDGPWAELSPQCADLLRGANPSVFAATSQGDDPA